jgi:heme/copper-type cytochrome/quinol oxidase subunit 1
MQFLQNYFFKNKHMYFLFTTKPYNFQKTSNFNFFFNSLNSNFNFQNNINNFTKTLSFFFDYSRLIKSILLANFWIKIRTLYYLNNWIYTTNHKRIAVNYFWFVILSGIVGMVLATVIRLEFAYPGVGIFAGDSIQYLSLASAHGVIMVFFMIMPLLFGAFANFLLPTQLGVHDVAFPRLNSAAFWFLPGGLLMLCQLVCVDRRYQRMNCFNIREIQSILKRKFFTDLINQHDHHTLLDKTAIGLKFKTQNINLIDSNSINFYNYGLQLSSQIKGNNYNFSNNYGINENNFFNSNFIFFSLIKKFSNSRIIFFINNSALTLINNTANYSNFAPNFKYIFMNPFSLILAITNYDYSNILLTIKKTLSIFNIFNHFRTLKFYISEFFSNILSTLLTYWISIWIYIAQNHLHAYLYWKKFNFHLKTHNYLAIIDEDIYNLPSLQTLHTLFVKIKDFAFDEKSINIKTIYNFSKRFLNLHNEITPQYIQYHWNLIYAFKDLIVFFFFLILSLIQKIRMFFAEIFTINTINVLNFNYLISYNRPLKNKIVKVVRGFFQEWDYDSKLTYVYVFFYNLFFLPYNCLKTLFFLLNPHNINNVSLISDASYNLFINWYISLLFNSNLFFQTFIDIDFFNRFALIPFAPKDKFNKLSLNSDDTSNMNDKITNFVNNFPSILSFLISLNVWANTNLSFFYNNLVLFINMFINIIFGKQTFTFFNWIYENIFLELQTFINLNKNNDFNKMNFFNSNYINNLNTTNSFKYSNEELSDNYRYLKFFNPVFKYDYKSGDYFIKLYKEVYTHMFSSILDLTSGLKTAPWFFSANQKEIFEINFLNYINNVNKLVNIKTNNSPIHSWNTNKFNHADGFYTFFFNLNNNSIFLNQKFVASNVLTQKFNKMFNGSSMQQRIYSNWRQLKFTREAWRCKLLAARHQKTLFRRYLNEDGVFWSIERNAKDLIPGWAMITPFSSRTRFTAIGKTDIGLMGVLLVLNSSIISAANFLVTYRYLSTLNNRKMRDARAFFTEAVMVSSWMMVLANPMLVIGIIMLLSDRHWQTSFFDYSGGGDTVLFQHMFWFFGHPEVYIIILPTFGFTNTMISYYLRKRVSARASLLYSMYTIAFLGFFVWGHHMYMVGLSHTTRMLFSTLTVMISVPAATKIMHWCVTTVNSSFAMELPLLFTFTFIFFFVSGGISGMCVAHTGMDVLFHDTFYVIGHFHVMLAGGAMFASFGAFYFYFPAIFGVKYSRIYAYLHYTYYLIGQLMTIIPMFWLGYAGMPRRVLDYPASFGGWHSVISAGHMLNVAGLIAFFIMIFDSLRQAKAATRNTFGINRYNIRLNFYIYEIAKLTYVQQKALFLYKFVRPNSIKLNNFNYINYEPYETVLLSYFFAKKK